MVDILIHVRFKVLFWRRTGVIAFKSTVMLAEYLREHLVAAQCAGLEIVAVEVVHA